MNRRPLLLLLLASAAPARAQEEIVVTGQGLRPPLAEAAYDVVEIGRQRLAGSASNRLEDVLRDVPGFQLFRRSDARSANPTSQGPTLRALGGNASGRALLLLDGVPQTDPFGGWISWPALDPRRLGWARILRGGGGGAAGPGALAGTIELCSASPAELGGVRGGIAYGSRGDLDAFAGLGIAAGPGFATISGSWMRGDGFVPVVGGQRGPADRPAPYDQKSLALRVAAPLGAAELQASGLWFADRRERGTALSDIATDGTDASVRLVGDRWSALAYLQLRDFYNSFASVDAARTAATRTSEQYSVPSLGLGARAEVRPRLGAAELRFGADWRETIGESRERFQFVAGEATRGRISGGRSRTLGAFAEIGLESGALTATGGVRLDRWSIAGGFLEERLLGSGGLLTDARYRDRSGWRPTARGGFAFRVSPALTLRTAAYLGWRLPTLNELYRPFRLGADATAANAELAPERLAGAEAGLEYRPARGVRIGLTLFDNRLSDSIGNVTLGQGPGTFAGVGFVPGGGFYRQRRNLDRIAVRGLEIDAGVERGQWSLSGGYSFADARVRASGPAAPLDGLRPAQTPRHSASAALAWQAGDGASASLTARWSGSQYEDDLNRQLLPSAFTADAAAALPLARRVALELRAENVTDERVVAGISGAGIIERATPRTLWVGLRLR